MFVKNKQNKLDLDHRSFPAKEIDIFVVYILLSHKMEWYTRARKTLRTESCATLTTSIYFIIEVHSLAIVRQDAKLKSSRGTKIHPKISSWL